jgi:protein-S-isoprenylcysteine O-methyltransferase Ste14
VPLVVRHGAAEVAFNVAVVAWLVFEFVMRVRQRLRASGPAAPDPSAFVLMPALVAVVIAAEVLGRRGGLPWPGGLIWPVVTGVALIVIGIGLRAWSIATLGRFFQYQIQVQPGHHVVTDGPYRYVRHPSYRGSRWCSPGSRWPVTIYGAWSLWPFWAARAWPFGSAPRNGIWPRRWATSTSTSRPATSALCRTCGERPVLGAASCSGGTAKDRRRIPPTS